MSVNIKIRPATKEDGAALLKIYERYIRDTAITFEYEVPTVAAFSERIENVLQQFPWLVCEIDGEVAGYAYAAKHRERAAYQWSADLSVYIDEKYHRQHIATELYTSLIALLKLQGYYSVFAGVTSPNPPSDAFHKAFGFEKVGVFQNVGYKLGAWRDVTWYKLSLADYPEEPKAPIAFSIIINSEQIDGIMDKSYL